MKIIETFKSLKRRNTQRFWKHPNACLGYIQLRDDKVKAIIRDELGLITGVPLPGTGYFYYDIVNIDGPLGKHPYRDEQVDLYLPTGVSKRSDFYTFKFEGIVPDARDYFRLLDAFKEQGCAVRFPWSTTNKDNRWQIGYCAATNLEMAERILTTFINSKAGLYFKELVKCD